MTVFFNDLECLIGSLLNGLTKMDGTLEGVRWTAMGIRRIMTFMLPWKENGEDDENCGKYFLKEMKENPNLDGDNS